MTTFSKPTISAASASTSTTTSSSNLIRAGPGGATASQACAACKHQRRRCGPECLLAPYFPAHQQKQFLNVHRLFGVSNVTKVIKSLQQKPLEQKNAVNSMIFQANVRASDPAGGCYRIIQDLKRQIERSEAELIAVLRQLSIYQQQEQRQVLNPIEFYVEGSDAMKGGVEALSSLTPGINELEDIKPLVGMFDEKLLVPFDPSSQTELKDHVIDF
ncbi:LOB domain-containing protein 22-like [Diospyros lotus]|uniref:LOB domain-containing protein 22-like n=1 Tax=Diospyros lotus TaxID=55363 RepID=UPI00224F838B|nr:LOB domain-containing protein 22-like [Diospyros lotus]